MTYFMQKFGRALPSDVGKVYRMLRSDRSEIFIAPWPKMNSSSFRSEINVSITERVYEAGVGVKKNFE